MQGIYTYIPEKNYVPREYSVAAILLLLFMVLMSLVPVFNLLYFYISTCRIIIIIIIIIIIYVTNFEVVWLAPLCFVLKFIVSRAGKPTSKCMANTSSGI